MSRPRDPEEDLGASRASPGALDAARWWDAAFGAAYLAVYAHRDEASARAEAAFAADVLGGVAGRRVLDAGCGAGRHARALASLGARVVGLDRSADLLAAAARAGRGPRYVRADLRALPLRTGTFDHVASFFTSFGYFDDAGDRAQLRELRRVARPGGGFVLDFLNAPRTATQLEPSSEREVGGRTVREERWIRRGRVEKSVEVLVSGALVARWHESVRLYAREEVAALLRDAGWRVVAEFGDLRGAPWSETAPRLVVHAVGV
jgi:SAM-dependent methyltransferase